MQRLQYSARNSSRPPASSGQPPVALPTPQLQEFCGRLADLMRWQTEGRLSGTECATAKTPVGLCAPPVVKSPQLSAL
eukprot:1016022-Lingulodinium_polyedra.AAC.1